MNDNYRGSRYTQERFSHLVGNASIGAIVRGVEGRTMVLVDTRYWKDKDGNCPAEDIAFTKRIIQFLNNNETLDIKKEIEKLKIPPAAVEDRDYEGSIDGSYLPAVLFPKWARCTKCGLLHRNPWYKKNGDKHNNKQPSEIVYCEQCQNNKGKKPKLEQVIYCYVSNQGHLDEVPWHYICHQNSQSECKEDYNANYLKLTTNGNGKNIVTCTKCKVASTYENFKQEGDGYINKQPWLYEREKLPEGSQVNVVDINDSAVYSPKTIKALVIPPESRVDKNTLEYKLYNNSVLLRELDEIQASNLPDFRKKGKYLEYTSKYDCTVDELKQAIAEIKKGWPLYDDDDEIFTKGDMKKEEYQAFLTPLDNVSEEEDFITEHHDLEELRQKYKQKQDLSAILTLVDRHIVVKRLREIQIFTGFRRGHQTDTSAQKDDKNPVSEKETGDTRNLVPPDIDGSTDWLPAIELFGEGVFFYLK